MSRPTKEEIIATAKTIASQRGLETLRRKDFVRESGISLEHVARLFPEGGWRAVLEAAGLKVDFQNTPTPDDDLLEEFHQIVRGLGRIPTKHLINARGEWSYALYQKRFGGIQGTLQRYHAWLGKNHPGAREFGLVEATLKQETTLSKVAPPESPGSQQWGKGSGIVYGAPINFRGLRHAPINEQGVVYLFGMVSQELGLIVEAVQSAYPDCEAKRCIDKRGDRWQRVRIEFEFRSRNFVEHGHDPAACDMVVCWENDWPECPVEVVELRTVIVKLKG